MESSGTIHQPLLVRFQLLKTCLTWTGSAPPLLFSSPVPTIGSLHSNGNAGGHEQGSFVHLLEGHREKPPFLSLERTLEEEVYFRGGLGIAEGKRRMASRCR